MTDEFGRHKSARWAKAAVPSYGDEWGDEYDYESDPSVIDDIVEADDSMIPQTFDTVDMNKQDESVASDTNALHHEFEAKELHPENVGAQNRHIAPNNLVLSIDKFSNNYSEEEEDDDDDDDELDNSTQNRSLDSNHGNFASKQIPTYAEPQVDQSVLSPKINVESASFDAQDSDSSYGSDADSIQFEPTSLNLVGTARKDEEPLQDNPNHESVYFTPNPSHVNHQPDAPADVPEQESVELANTKSQSNDTYNAIKTNEKDIAVPETDTRSADQFQLEAEQAEKDPVTFNSPPAPLVLSIDDTKNRYDSSSDSDDWGHNSDEDSESEHEAEAPLAFTQLGTPGKASHDYSKEISNEVTSRNVSGSSTKQPIKTDALDSLIYDLQKASVEGEDGQNDRELLPPVDTSGLDIPDFADQSFSKYEHEGYNYDDESEDGVDDDVLQTTPISSIPAEDGLKRHDTYVKELSSRPQSMRKPPSDRTNLMSVDYSNIADAVSGYMPDARNTIISEDVDLNKDLPDGDDHTIHSTGSLSTGKLSLGTQKEDNESAVIKDVESEGGVSRRESTMSTATLSFGNWKPNTSGFRDKFIAGSDRDSLIHFDPTTDEGNYSKFTTMQGSQSFDSIPETIDAALPSVAEVLDSEDTDDKLFPTMSSMTNESLLNTRTFTPRFQEETLTLTSKENLHDSQTQKYSSLLGPSGDAPSVDPSSTRVVSEATTLTNQNDTGSISTNEYETPEATLSESSTKKAIDPTLQSYPVFNWKQIMAISQPVDRIALLQGALAREYEYDTGLHTWLQEMLTKSDNSGSMHIGKIAAAAYQNAPHSEIIRRGSLRSQLNIVKDKVEGTGLHASSFGKRFFNKSKKLMKGGASD